jgi:hypothetical protein
VGICYSGRGTNSILQAIVRNLWLFEASFDYEVQVSHIKDSYNHGADLLSRWGASHNHLSQLFSILNNIPICDIPLRGLCLLIIIFKIIKIYFLTQLNSISFIFTVFPPSIQHYQTRIHILWFRIDVVTLLSVVDVVTLLAFLELLLVYSLTLPTICSYISSVKARFKLCNVTILAFEAPPAPFGLILPHKIGPHLHLSNLFFLSPSV